MEKNVKPLEDKVQLVISNTKTTPTCAVHE